MVHQTARRWTTATVPLRRQRLRPESRLEHHHRTPASNGYSLRARGATTVMVATRVDFLGVGKLPRHAELEHSVRPRPLAATAAEPSAAAEEGRE